MTDPRIQFRRSRQPVVRHPLKNQLVQSRDDVREPLATRPEIEFLKCTDLGNTRPPLQACRKVFCWQQTLYRVWDAEARDSR